jgi:hypothetical protein
MINTGDPDIGLIQETVQQAIDRAEGTADKPGKAKKNPRTINGGSLGSYDDGYRANQSEDLGAAC